MSRTNKQTNTQTNSYFINIDTFYYVLYKQKHKKNLSPYLMFKSGSQWYTASSADSNTVFYQLRQQMSSWWSVRLQLYCVKKNESEIVEELSLNAK